MATSRGSSSSSKTRAMDDEEPVKVSAVEPRHEWRRRYEH